MEPLRRVLTTTIPADRLAPARTTAKLQLTLSPDAVRTPYFCSGCPHNTGTLVPEGALVGAGIGCHGMVSFMSDSRRGTITGITQMGGEGSQWIGIAPFVEDPHLFQNVGDGTFFHSGQLAVQAAVAAGVDMTFKLLYNAAVAMTGGQDATGLRPVPDIATKLLSEGVKEVIITTDDPGKYRGTTLPKGAKVMHRDKIIEAQEHLQTVPGVTVLIHDQQCAAEKRRDRKRGLLPRPGFKIMIDERVCEGCGDCGVQSNCLSLQPIDTELGRKTTIDQASCNLDVSCLKGDCPAFVTVRLAKGGGRSRRPGGVLDGTDAPEPARIVPAAGATLRMPGIGGTGVVTVSQMLAAAAAHGGHPLPLGGSDRPQPEGRAGGVHHLDRRAGARARRRPHRLRPHRLRHPGQPQRPRCRCQRRGRLYDHHPDRAHGRAGRHRQPRPHPAGHRARRSQPPSGQPLRRCLAASPPGCSGTR